MIYPLTLAVMVDYWRLLMLAGTVLAVLKFCVCGCRPETKTGVVGILVIS